MYITDLKAISSQDTYSSNFLEGDIREIKNTTFDAFEPNYLEFIPKGLLRRMGKAVRMGVGVGLPLVKKHNDIDGIIIGTANGGLEDCIKFLNQIVEYDEGVLTPTNFVQSTPNAVAGQLALMGQNNSYNITYTNGGTSFENAILDALLLFEENNAEKLLIGGLEEISDYNYNIDLQADKYKDELVSNLELLDSKTKGTVCGEGANLFIVEKDAKDYFAEIIDIEQITYPNFDDLSLLLETMLEKNNLSIDDIDSVMLGYNGDIRHNKWYDFVGKELLANASQYSFKNLIGDFRSVSSFAVWLSAHLLNGTLKDESSILIEKKEGNKASKKKYHLIYNNFDTVRHGFILLSK